MTAAPPKMSPSRANARLAMVILGATALGLAALVFFFNPATHHFYPVCQFHRLTGLNCPGCGMTRALFALLHGKFLDLRFTGQVFVFPSAARYLHAAAETLLDRPGTRAARPFAARWAR